jgi:hypothetical protein
MVALRPGEMSAEMAEQVASELARMMDGHVRTKVAMSIPGCPRQVAQDHYQIVGQLVAYGHLLGLMGIGDSVLARAKEILAEKAQSIADC